MIDALTMDESLNKLQVQLTGTGSTSPLIRKTSEPSGALIAMLPWESIRSKSISIGKSSAVKGSCYLEKNCNV